MEMYVFALGSTHLSLMEKTDLAAMLSKELLNLGLVLTPASNSLTHPQLPTPTWDQVSD